MVRRRLGVLQAGHVGLRIAGPGGAEVQNSGQARDAISSGHEQVGRIQVFVCERRVSDLLHSRGGAFSKGRRVWTCTVDAADGSHLTESGETDAV